MSLSHKNNAPIPKMPVPEVLFSPLKNKVDSEPTKIEQETILGEKESQPKHSNKKRKTPNERLVFFIQAVEKLYTAISESDIADEKIAQLKSTLPKLLDLLKQKHEHFVHMLFRPQEGKEDFEVTVSHLLFGLETEYNDNPAMKEFFISYTAEKLEAICKDYFEIDVKELGLETSQESTEDVANETSDTNTELTVTKYDQLQLIKNILSAMGQTKDAIMVILSSILQTPAVLSTLLRKLLTPELAARLMMKQIMSKKPRFSQRPGAGSFFDKMMPMKLFSHNIKNKKGESSLAFASLYTSTNFYSEYDSTTDEFVGSDQYSDPQPYKRESEIYRGRTNQMLTDLREHDQLYDLKILHVIPDVMTDKKTGLCAIPTPALNSKQVELIPISFSVFVPGEEYPRECPLFFDQDQLYFDPSSLPPNAKDMTGNLEYTTWNKNTDKSVMGSNKRPMYLDFFMKNNSAYFNREKQRSHTLDAKVAEINLPADLTKKIEEWGKLPTVQDKVRAVSDYFMSEFAYGLGIFTRIRVALQPGKSPVEKIVNAKEGNCFDANKIGYIVLQKLGIPTELHTGFTDPSVDENPVKGEKTFMIPNIKELPLGTEVGVEAENALKRTPQAHSKHVRHTTDTQGHAFLQFFNEETQQWLRLDLTPSQSKSELANANKFYDRHAKKAEVWEIKRTQLEQAKGMIPFKEYIEKWSLMKEKFQDRPEYQEVHFGLHIFFANTEMTADDDHYHVYSDPNLDGYHKTEKSYAEAYDRNQLLFPIIEHFKQQKEKIILDLCAPVENAVEDFFHRMRTTSKTSNDLQAEIRYVWGRTLGISEDDNSEPKDLLLKFVLANRNGLPNPFKTFTINIDGSYSYQNEKLTGTPEEIIAQVQSLTDADIASWAKEEAKRMAILVEVINSAERGVTAQSLYDSIRKKCIEEKLIEASEIDKEPTQADIDKSEKRFIQISLLKRWMSGEINGTVIEAKHGRALRLTDQKSGVAINFYGNQEIKGFDEAAMTRVQEFYTKQDALPLKT